jgi:uncharacterized protein YbjT (DUF2867 family)
MILVVGATAPFGRQAVTALLAAGQPVRALTRRPDAADLPAGVEIVRADLTDPSTLPPAVAGVTAMLLVLPYGLDPGPLLAAARDAAVQRIVFLSSGAVVDGAETQPDVIAAYHADVEQQVAASGAQWTFLRLFFPAINALSFGFQLKGGKDVVRGPYAQAASAPVHEDDVGAVAAAVLTGDGHAGAVYELSGPQTLTQADQVRVIGEVIDRPLRFEELDPATVREQLSGFMEPAFVAALLDLMAGTVDVPAAVTSTVLDITGRPPRTFADWAADHADAFR